MNTIISFLKRDEMEKFRKIRNFNLKLIVERNFCKYIMTKQRVREILEDYKKKLESEGHSVYLGRNVMIITRRKDSKDKRIKKT